MEEVEMLRWCSTGVIDAPIALKGCSRGGSIRLVG
jgi:hypothetical protein